MSKKRTEEVKVIAESPKRRPYASKISLILGEGLEYGFDGEACLLIDTNYIVRVRPEKEKINEKGKVLQKLTATIEGFDTAGKAEQMGLKLSLALLWTAVSKKWNLKLDYHTPQPCMVFDRTQSTGGLRITGHGTIHVRSSASKVSELINEVLSKEMEFNPKLLISMELFASARLESTERAKFIGLVSALEPLAVQESYDNEDVDNLISSFISKINEAKTIPENIRSSLIGRASSLSSESISQAIARFVGKYFPENTKIIKSVKEAYDIRSSILHEGTFDADLDEKGKFLEDAIRHIYSQILGLNLLFPVDINKMV